MGATALFLLPNVLGEEENLDRYLPVGVNVIVKDLDALVAESEKEGRRFLKRFAYEGEKTFRDIQIFTLNEHTEEADLKALVTELKKKKKVGVISDAGLPCLADPGSSLVERGRREGWDIEAWMGPSAIIQALMLSGFTGQRFCFYGYLRKESDALLQQIKTMEKRSQDEEETQLFIEAPYRSTKMLTQLLETLHPETRLCVACDLTLKSEEVHVYKIADWKKLKELPALNKRPCVFLFKK